MAAEQHHYVPKWYLSGFADAAGEVHYWDRDAGHFRHQKPNKIMRQRNYYRQDWLPEGVDPYALERFASSVIEDRAKPTFKHLLEAPHVPMSAEEGLAMNSYIEFQWTRVPRQAKTARSRLHHAIMMSGNHEMIETYLTGQLPTERVRFDFMREMMNAMMPYTARMLWKIWTAPDDCSFITSDNPVVLVNSAIPPFLEADIAYIGTRVVFPLSAKHALVMTHPGYDATKDYPLTPVPKPLPEDGQLNVNIWPPADDEHEVRLVNQAIIQRYERYVASSSRDNLQKYLPDMR